MEACCRATALAQGLADEFPAEAIYQYQIGQARNWLGFLLWESGHRLEAAEPFRAAERAYRRGVALDPPSAHLLNVLAWHLTTCPDPVLRNLREAIDLARKAIDLDSSPARIWNTLGVACYRAGRWDEAIRALEAACRRREGGSSGDLFVLAMAHWRAGNRERSREIYRQACGRFERELPPIRQSGTFHAEAAALIEPSGRGCPAVRSNEPTREPAEIGGVCPARPGPAPIRQSSSPR